MSQEKLEQFYIPEEQSIYLLSHDDARKLRDWVALCRSQLEQLVGTEIQHQNGRRRARQLGRAFR